MIINCVAYQDGRKLADIPVEDISEYVRRPECFVWVALKDPDDAELATLQEEFELHELAVEDARKGHQRPKIEEYGDSLFVVLRTVEALDDECQLGEVGIFVGTNYVLSTRRGTRKGFVDVRARCEREPELLRLGSGFVLYALMDAVVDRYFPVIEMIEGEVDLVEERIFSGETGRASVEALYTSKRKLVQLQHAVRPLLDATTRLFGGRVPPVCVGMQEYFRDVADHLSRINAAIDGLRETLTTAMSVNLSLISLQENETTKQLAAYGALIAVPTMIAGLYGMNFQHMPELSWGFGYPLALAVMVGIDVYLFRRFRRAKWL
jgi:magnesium transporter